MSDDIGLDEKRVYADREEATTAFVAAGAGVARVEVSADIVGEFALQRRCTARDIAASAGRLAVATAEDVLVGTVDGFEPTGFGPATAVGYHEGLVAAGGERLARYHDDGWETLAELTDVRAIDGDLVAAADGVHRLDGTPLGLEAVNDVSTAGRPLAATDAGLYYLANGWMTAVEGPFRAVARDADDETAHAAGERLYEREASDEPSGRREARAKRAPRTGERRVERAGGQTLGRDDTRAARTASGGPSMCRSTNRSPVSLTARPSTPSPPTGPSSQTRATAGGTALWDCRTWPALPSLSPAVPSRGRSAVGTAVRRRRRRACWPVPPACRPATSPPGT